MWKVGGFDPNSKEIDAGVGFVSSDGQGRLKTCRFKEKFGGVTATAYYQDDFEYIIQLAKLKHLEDKECPLVGDWIQGRHGEIAQVLGSNVMVSRGHYNYLVYTIFGVNNFAYPPIEMFIDKMAYGSLATSKTMGIKRFSKTKEEIIGAYVLNNFDPYAAFEVAYGKKIETLNQKSRAKQVVKQAIASKTGSRFLLETIRERLLKSGIDGGMWVKKLIESVPGPITNETERKIWEMVGMLEPSVRKQILESRGEIDNPTAPFQVPSGQEQIAQFTECDVCHGTKEIIATSTRGIKFKAQCPKCCDAVPESRVSETTQKLKL